MNLKFVDSIVSKQNNPAIKSPGPVQIKVQKKLVPVDGIQRRLLISAFSNKATTKKEPFFSEELFRPFFLLRKMAFARLPIYLSFVLVVIAFVFGIWFTLNTPKSTAEALSQTSQAAPENYVIPLPQDPNAVKPIADIPNEVLFNLTVQQLESYLEEALKTPELKAAQQLADRKAKLTAYLTEKKSPLVETVNTLAELKHWKLVLAISNSESTLGKRCYNNNCSGIGVEPGNPLWRDYKSKAEWAKDLDGLLEKKYKDWTLEEMNGVYNKPGSKNWLYAAKQVLEEMEERGIE